MRDNGTTPIKGYHPVFSAPEVVNGTATKAADVYSLGATMVHLLYGVNGDFLTNAGRIESEDLRTILQKCLSSDPNDRYADAKTLWVDGLESYRWAKVEERLPRTLKDRFIQIFRAKKDFWQGVGAAVVGDFTLVATGTGTAPCFSTTA
jgi:serine/threonine protein kinase